MEFHKRIHFSNRQIYLKDILDITIKDVIYKNNNTNIFYIFLKKSIKNISIIKTTDFIYLLKNGLLHSFDGPAIIQHNRMTKMITPEQYYIYGDFYFALEFFKNEKRLNYIKQQTRIKKLKNIIK